MAIDENSTERPTLHMNGAFDAPRHMLDRFEAYVE
jgi:hypothetical protein